MTPSNDLKEIIINDGSHLVIGDTHTVNNILGDGRSMIHTAPNTSLFIEQEFTTHAYIYNRSSVVLAAVPEVTLVGTIFVQGHLMMANPMNQSLILSQPGKVKVDSTDMTSLSLHSLSVGENCEFTINNPSTTFSLITVDFLVYGAFTAGTLDIVGIDKFEVGTLATVEFDPETSDMYIGSDIDIRGAVALGKHVSVVYPCIQFILDAGTLTWPATSDIITIECDIVTINGMFSPGAVSFGSGVGHFTVGSSGTFTLTADGPVLVDSAIVSGKMYVTNLATFKSNSSVDERIDTFIVSYPTGVLELNKNNLPAQLNGTAQNDTCSTLMIKSLTIDKTFTASDISIGDGIDEITVNRFGDWSFTPCDVFRMDTLYTNGTITSTTPLEMEGIGVHKVREIYIEYGGTITLDSLVQSNKAWTGVSTVGVHDFKMYGKFYAGLLQNYVAGDEGWDKLDIYVNGTFYFESFGPFYIEYLYTNGRFECYSAINMTSSDSPLTIHVDSKGYVKFDSLVSSNWVEESAVNASQVLMDSSSYWSSGNTKWTVTTADISGRLYSHPYSDVQIVYFAVKNGGTVDFSRQTTMKGFNLTVNSGGTLDMAYQHTPDVATEGCEETRILYKEVDISGTARAGSLFIGPLGNGVQFCENIDISGTLDVSGGGYLYDQGPGKTLFSLVGI